MDGLVEVEGRMREDIYIYIMRIRELLPETLHTSNGQSD
jgi:hypothetical protein